ncbi:hypothetical protein ACS0PU_002271 [Formica fusca]
MENVQGVTETHREEVGQEKETVERGIVEEKGRIMKGKVGAKGTERRGSTGNIEEMWKRKRELMEGLGGKRAEEEMGIAKKGKIKGSPQKEIIKGGEEEKSWLREMKEEWKKEMKDGIREIRKMLREELRGHIGDLKEEMEGLVKMRLNEREKLWEREREDLKKKVEGLEQEIIKLKSREEGKGKIGEEKGGEMERKLKEMEKWKEMKEREERRRNVVVRGVRGGVKEVEIKVRELR